MDENGLPVTDDDEYEDLDMQSEPHTQRSRGRSRSGGRGKSASKYPRDELDDRHLYAVSAINSFNFNTLY